MNAQALKRQVADSQKLAEQYRALKKECNRLEQECELYHNDRDVFEEAACEAEDRAAEAEDRAAQAERKNEELIEELERVGQTLAQDGRVTLEVCHKALYINSRVLCSGFMKESPYLRVTWSITTTFSSTLSLMPT
jgi:uncharacterized membrane protein YgaE (UPF0421/DUF939 family)